MEATLTPDNPAPLASEVNATAVLRALFHSMLWPAAAAVSLSVALGGRAVTALGLALVAAGTMAAYGLDRLIDNRGRDPRPLRNALFVCVAIAALATGVLACTAWWRFKMCNVLAVVAGAYVPLKAYIPKNVLTVFAWTAAVATLPFATQPSLDATFGASVLAVAAIMAANTILCDIPDYAADHVAGVRGITPQFGPRAGAIAAVSFAGVGAAVAGSVGRWGLSVTALSLGVLAILLVRQPKRRLYRLLADGVVTVLPGPLALFFR